ncbi:MAG: hypothetical protein Q8L87_00630 [Anaerolineales bacterium]|nr:hypothetical protein [Anaerolineales bacterium]
MTDEILYGLMEVFKLANNQYLKLSEITRRMQDLGFYQNVEFAKANTDIYVYYLKPPIFHESKNYKNKNWGRQWKVTHWLPSKENNLQNNAFGTVQTEKEFQSIALSSASEAKNNPPNSIISPLQIGEEIQRTISPSGSEIEDGVIPLYGKDFDIFFASMDKEQQRQLNINLHYYASERITCNIAKENGHWLLKGASLKKWYLENRVSPGDKIWLVVENVKPLAIRIYTEWERNLDTYRRHRQLQSGKPIISVDTPIRDIIWDYLEEAQIIKHRLDIAKDVLEKRPEVSEQSVYACLSANPHLFVRIGEGNWGLKEWGLEEIKATVPPAGSTLEENRNLPTTTVSLDYILANIAAENLVYRILEKSPNPLSVGEITERISKFYNVNKDVLARATFFDPSDPRFRRQEDGAFTLRKNLEEVIQMAENERALRTSTENKIQKLQEAVESSTSQHKKEMKQLKDEQDILRKLVEELIEQVDHYEKINHRREKRIQILSAFLAEAASVIGQDKLKDIFENLHRKSETTNTFDPSEIDKFSKIMQKISARLQD